MLDVPGATAAVLRGRLTHLPKAVRQILHCAAVLGDLLSIVNALKGPDSSVAIMRWPVCGGRYVCVGDEPAGAGTGLPIGVRWPSPAIRNVCTTSWSSPRGSMSTTSCRVSR